MAGKITIQLLTESQKGTIGNDWKYSLEAKVFSGARIGKGTIKVPKHELNPGATQAPPGEPPALVLPGGEPSEEVTLDLHLAVAEVDLLINDTGSSKALLKRTCPAAGAPPVVEDHELTVTVSEEPSGVGSAVFKLGFRITLASE